MDASIADPVLGRSVKADFLVGDCLVQPSLGQITRGEVKVRLEPKVVEVLLCLARRPSALVSKDEIIRTVWADTFVTEHVLTHAIWQLRRALGESGDSGPCIETFPKRGYRLVAPVRAAPVRIRSLAVLPLLNLAGDVSQDYLADGITEMLITELAQISAVRVISRTSSMLYKSSRKSLAEIASELNVDGIVEGTVMRVGDRVRITAQLIQGATDRHLWANSYEGELRDLLRLQSEVARAIAGEIQVTLRPHESTRLGRPRSVDSQAYEAYLKGRYCHNRASEEGLRSAIAYMQEAMAKDPEYALAYAGLADSVALLASPVAEAIAPAEANAIMRPAVLRALELDPHLPEAHHLLGWMKTYYEWDWEGARLALDRALELNPNYALAYAGLATLGEALGEFDGAIQNWRRASELDPLSLLFNTLRGWVHVLAGMPAKAVEQLQKVLTLEPNFWFAHEVLALALVSLGSYDRAITEAEASVRLSGNSVFPKGALGHVYGAAGRRTEALQILNELRALSAHRYVSPNLHAYVYAGLGELDCSLEWMEKAYAVHDPSLIWLKSFPRLWKQPLAEQAGYRELLHRMNFPR